MVTQNPKGSEALQPKHIQLPAWPAWIRSFYINSIIARPWLDPICLWAITQKIMPLSKLWALVGDPTGNIEQLWAQIPPLKQRPSFAKMYDLLKYWQKEAVAQEQLWQHIMWANQDFSDEKIWQVNQHKQQAWQRWIIQGKRKLLPYASSLRLPKINFHVPNASHQPIITDAIFQQLISLSQKLPVINVSKKLPTQKGQQYWLTFSNGLENVWATVFEPPLSKNQGTFIYCHGWGVEGELSGLPLEPEIGHLIDCGVRVIRLESSAHGRRCPPGYYDGEHIFASAPPALVEFMMQQVHEIGVLLHWCKLENKGPVALGGTSLGALSSQTYVSLNKRLQLYPQPDILYLSATDPNILALAGDSQLCIKSGLSAALTQAGWSKEKLDGYQPLVQVSAEPPINPNHIIMVMGNKDQVTSYHRAKELAIKWQVRPNHLFERRQGHFSLQLGLLGDQAPINSLYHLLQYLR